MVGSCFDVTPSGAKRVRKPLDQLAADPRHPGLRTKRCADDVWQSYVGNNTPRAWRLWWVYDPTIEDAIIVIGFGPHPSSVIQMPSNRSSTVTDLALVTVRARESISTTRSGWSARSDAASSDSTRPMGSSVMAPVASSALTMYYRPSRSHRARVTRPRESGSTSAKLDGYG